MLLGVQDGTGTQVLTVEDVITQAYQARWARLSALVMLIWDHATCLDREVELVWQRDWTRFTILYTVVRYGAALAVAFFVAAYIWPTPSDTFCIAWAQIEGYFGSFAILTIQFIQATRVIGLYNNSRRVQLLVSGALLLSFAGMTCTWALHTPFALSYRATVEHTDFLVCHATQSARYLWMIWISPLAYDTIICSLAIYRGITMYREDLNRGKKLITVIIRDSILYYVVIFWTDTSVATVWYLYGGPGPKMHSVTMFAGTVPLLMSCHLVLNLRDEYYVPQNVYSVNATQLDTIHSRDEQGVDQLDSMGFPRISSWHSQQP